MPELSTVKKVVSALSNPTSRGEGFVNVFLVGLLVLILWWNLTGNIGEARDDAKIAKDTTQTFKEDMSEIKGSLKMLVDLKKFEMGVGEFPTDTIVDTVFIKDSTGDTL